MSQPSNFALQVTDNTGATYLTPLTINILNAPPANVVFIATPTTVSAGQCTQLQWIAGNARSVNLLDSSTGSNTSVGSWGDVRCAQAAQQPTPFAPCWRMAKRWIDPKR